MAAAKASNGAKRMNSAQSHRRIAVTFASSGTTPCPRQRMKAIVGAMDSSPTATKVAILAQKKRLWL